ncbi:hypothetical protein SAMN02745194_01236 [Roseomonas rosea]|uniref:Uncharacterized protein n=1 Tax=Muricoccus roseus TaxID=198092 RepID=A0A1M6EPQ9_9PROT|nr:hypothetical protein [Roseomonas rosea]SHI87464.1 hypothetical protein SAMN02745194_01236 [Roseomonas rosea]
MASVSEQRLFDALAVITRAFADGGVPALDGAESETGAGDPSPAIDALNDETREVLGEAALAVAFGAFASRGGDGGPIHTLTAAMGLMAILADEEPDPPAEIQAIAADDGRVEAEIDRAGEAVDQEFGREASGEAVTGALEARILGTALTLAGCTLPEGVDGQAAVRLRAARLLTRLAAGMLLMNLTSTAAAGAVPDAPAQG